MPKSNARSIVVCVALSLAGSGCTAHLLSGSERSPDGGASLERPRVPPQADPCGNGVDDDGNGLIDDGCPCGPGETQACFAGMLASRGVGACADGVQTCAASAGTEWGDWGDSPCVGGVTPEVEACDGGDRDCDRAVDEGCPCTAGQISECGVEFLLGECRPGAQTCRADGTWSGCDGAVGPRSEVCDSARDEDCDGDIDELCGCSPEPELCGNGIDDDCDDAIDEPACGVPPPYRDASTAPPRGDAGLPDRCAHDVEICGDGIDDDCDATVDEGCASPECECTIGPAVPFGTTGPRFGFVAHNDRDDEYAITTLRVEPDACETTLQRVAPDGRTVASSVVATTPRPPGGGNRCRNGVEWLGNGYLVYEPFSIDSGSFTTPESYDGVRVSPEGAVLGTAPRVRRSTEAAAQPDGSTPFSPVRHVRLRGVQHAVWIECRAWETFPGAGFLGVDAYECSDSALVIQPLTDALEGAGAPQRVRGTADHLDRLLAVIPAGDDLVVYADTRRALPSAAESTTFMLVRDGALVGRAEVSFGAADGGQHMALGTVAFDDERFLACFTRGNDHGSVGWAQVRCQYHARSDGAPLGAPFAGMDSGYVNAVVPLVLRRGRCGFELFFEREDRSLPAPFTAWESMSLIGPAAPTYREIALTPIGTLAPYRYEVTDRVDGEPRLLETDLRSLPEGSRETVTMRDLHCGP